VLTALRAQTVVVVQILEHSITTAWEATSLLDCAD